MNFEFRRQSHSMDFLKAQDCLVITPPLLLSMGDCYLGFFKIVHTNPPENDSKYHRVTLQICPGPSSSALTEMDETLRETVHKFQKNIAPQFSMLTNAEYTDIWRKRPPFLPQFTVKVGKDTSIFSVVALHRGTLSLTCQRANHKSLVKGQRVSVDLKISTIFTTPSSEGFRLHPQLYAERILVDDNAVLTSGLRSKSPSNTDHKFIQIAFD